MLGPITMGIGLGALLTTMLLFMTKTGQDYSRIWFGWSLVIAAGMLVAFKSIARKLLAGDTDAIKFVVIGSNHTARAAQEKFSGNHQGPYCVERVECAHFKKQLAESNSESAVFRLSQFNGRVDELWVTHDVYSSMDNVALEKSFGNTAARVVYLPELPNISPDIEIEISYVRGIPTIGSDVAERKRLDNLCKVTQDKVLASIGLILLFPLLIIIACLIKLDSAGPVLFTQSRYGRAGKKFNILKFRTMYERENDHNFKQAIKNDPRVTKVGRFLRRSSLDELPQLLNVLNGSMSLVGPRPHPVELNEEFRGIIDGYMNRHRVKPGITGLAQINGFRGETSTDEDMKQRVLYDLKYINGWNTLLDIQIIFKTILLVFGDDRAY